MPSTNYGEDLIPRTPGTSLRIATFNVENLFSRPIAMDYEDNRKGQPFLDAYHELNGLFAKDTYADADKARILDLMQRHKLVGTRPSNKHLEFRKIRGHLIRKKNGRYIVAAEGRSDWVGWIELKEKAINDRAIQNTARVIAAVDADIQVLVEIEDRPGLVKFHDGVLLPILEATGRTGYPYALVVDGNDQRGIDVGILSRHPITDISTHIFDRPGAPPVFSRDCAEYFIEVPGVPGRLVVMTNHFTSKGSDRDGMRRRIHQADLVREIVDQRRAQGFTHIVVAGDLNDTPDSESLDPLIASPELTDVIAEFGSSIDPRGQRLGTYLTGKAQLDYLMVSNPLKSIARGAGIERRGCYAPRTFKSFESIGNSRDQASDHHAVWVDLAN
ncbi:MAG: endonuclease/exonuclease/phosphatase family protein [Sinimarinibacterium flocculans]|uniref:endonuclease/exonuclease/phosphatase family protein n=1 Tax=Sinimarinibacterium flocculans TaxID=985250 RepID=UPI002EB89F33|nr:endonuclease/exonuclease/phosphatase family protein [Pseudomonadota bacterium]